MARRCLIALVVVGSFAASLIASVPPDETDRLARLARVWAAVKYLHPFMVQRPIDWDGALVRAIPKVRAAETDEDVASAVGSMLTELGDPATRVVKKTSPSSSAREATLFRNAGDLLIVNAGPYAEAKGGLALLEERVTLAQQLRQSKQALIDVRHHSTDPDEAGMFAYAMSEVTGLTTEAVTAPSSLVVFHSGYRPQQGPSSGGYFTGLLTVPGPTFEPATGSTAPTQIIFVTDSNSSVPAIAVALRDAGKALIASNAPMGDETMVNTMPVALNASWRAVIRVEQIVGTDFTADVVAADPWAEALAMMEGKKPVPTPRARASSGTTANVRWQPDADYREMVYPDVAHRLLAAFRTWSVIHYFYPYKSLIGDWDAALTDAIPQFIAAGNEDEYAMAVLQMVARVEDGHSSAFGHPAVSRILGRWRVPIEVREVEHELVVTKLLAGIPADVDVRVGDIVVSAHGEPLRERIARLRKYVTASTDAARMNRVVAVALQGTTDSPVLLSLRGADQQLRSVSLPRVQAAQPAAGEPFRMLDGNIGYVDLTRLTPTQVDGMFETFKATIAIIFDMRGYPRGTAWSIAPYINTKGAKVGATFRRAQVSGATTFEEAASGFYFDQPLPTSAKPKYTGKTVMLIDDRAISQSEHTALFFEAANDTTFIGMPTAGANGDVTRFRLPGGFTVSFTGHDVRHADGRQLQRVGIQPHIRVAPTIDGLRSGRDEVLERALAFLKRE